MRVQTLSLQQRWLRKGYSKEQEQNRGKQEKKVLLRTFSETGDWVRGRERSMYLYSHIKRQPPWACHWRSSSSSNLEYFKQNSSFCFFKAVSFFWKNVNIIFPFTQAGSYPWTSFYTQVGFCLSCCLFTYFFNGSWHSVLCYFQVCNRVIRHFCNLLSDHLGKSSPPWHCT